MANTNVNEYNYNYAHECYIAYYNNTGTEEQRRNGKLVAESEKWKSYVIKWQSEDSTTYDEGDYKDEKLSGVDSNVEDEKKTRNKGLALGIGAGGAGAASGSAAVALVELAKKTGDAAKTGSIVAAAAYAAVGVVFLALCGTVINKAIASRNQENQYINQTTPIMEYNFDAALGKAGSINEMIAGYQAAAYELTQQAGAEVNLSNNVSNVMTGANNPMAFAAMGNADATAGETSDELEGINSEILSMCAEYDTIITEVQGQKLIADEVKEKTAEHNKNRKMDKTAMLSLAIGATAAALAGVVGIAMSWGNLVAAAAAVALFAVGVITFGASALLGFAENKKQGQVLETGNQYVETATNTSSTASETDSDLSSFQAESNASYQSTLDMQEQMNEENANYTGEAV